MRILFALLFLVASASAGDFRWAVTDQQSFSWAVTEKGGDPDVTPMQDASPSSPGSDGTEPSAPVSVEQFVHRINVQSDQGACVYLGKHDGYDLLVTAGHIFQDDQGNYYPAWTPIKIDGVQYGGWWSASTSGDAVVLRMEGIPDWPAAEYEARPIDPGERLTIYGRKSGLHEATATDTNWNRKGTSRLMGLGLEVDVATDSGDSGSGVFDASGVLVAVHSHQLSDSETLCTPLVELKTTLKPFDGKEVQTARKPGTSSQSQWLDGFTGIYLATASWCGACQIAKRDTVPKLEANGWPVEPIDTDANPDFVAAFNVTSIPAWFVIQNGKLISQSTGTGMPTTEKPDVSQHDVTALPNEAGPTPHAEISRILGILKLQADDVYADIGCGADARWCVLASEESDCRRIKGIEIDPERAASARACVESLGLSGRIEIIEGDALEVDLSDVTVATCYLYAETLDALRPKLTQMDRFASYLHPVPGLAMYRHGTAYVWNSADQVQPTSSGKRYAVWQGVQYDESYQPCGNWWCDMCYGPNGILAQQGRR